VKLIYKAINSAPLRVSFNGSAAKTFFGCRIRKNTVEQFLPFYKTLDISPAIMVYFLTFSIEAKSKHELPDLK